MDKKKKNQRKKKQSKCYLCGQEGHIRYEYSALKKPPNKWSRKTQAKINLISEHQIDSDEKEHKD